MTDFFFGVNPIPGVCLITSVEVKKIQNRELAIPRGIHTLVFTDCSPYSSPVYQSRVRESLVFPGIPTVVFWRNEKYFQDSWIFEDVFPDTKEIWVQRVPGGFFQFGRPKNVKWVIPESQEYRGYPTESTDSSRTDEEWQDAVFNLGFPQDLYGYWGRGLNKKYIGYDGVNVFF